MPEDLFELGEPGPMRDRLVEAVLEGQKTATSALRVQYEMDEEPLPVVGEERVMIDSAGDPVGRIVLTDVAVIRLGDADDRLAKDEGEGFESAAHWRSAHEDFWRTHVLPELPFDFVLNDDTEIVVEHFELSSSPR
jgi:uncharacterized protein YhfF